MIKINPIRQLIFCKLLQIFTLVFLYGFSLAFFISSVFYLPEKIIIPNTAYSDMYQVGFFHVMLGSGPNFNLSLSNYFITYVFFICLFLVISIINAFWMFYRFRFDKHLYLDVNVCFIVGIILVVISIFLTYFVQSNSLSVNSNGWSKMNAIFEYHSSTKDNVSILKMHYSKAGIAYIILLSYSFLGLMYFPFKILYNLVKARYI